jgi:hypothetical protein
MVEKTTIDESRQRSAICALNAVEETIAAIHQPNYIPWLGYISGHKTDLLVDICRAIGASTYLAGTGSKCYQEDVKFEEAGITPVYSCFSQQNYPC